MRRARSAALALAACFLPAAAAPATATIYLSASGGALHLSGEFENGDEARLAEYLAARRERPIRVVYLDSFGGQIGAGIKLGRLIRKAGLATAVDARNARCDSACTLIFAGGVRRHYVNAGAVFEGYSSRGGLGYHPAHWRDGSWTQAGFSESGTAMMERFYREMGQPGAVGLMRRAGFTSIFRPSGETAMRLGIATSLAPPAD